MRAVQQEEEIHRLREHYNVVSEVKKLRYDYEKVKSEILQRINLRTKIDKTNGEISSFLFFPESNYISSMRNSLSKLGPLSIYDYGLRGYKQSDFAKRTTETEVLRSKMNEEFVHEVITAHRNRRLDWILCFANPLELNPSTVQKIIEVVGVPIVNITMDDINSWSGSGSRPGLKLFANTFDVSWTTSRLALDWYTSEGGRPVLLAEGFDDDIYNKHDVRKDIDVSFVGQCYGIRPIVIKKLREAGINVQTYGPGWDSGHISVEKQVEIFCRSKVNLGFGGIGHTLSVCNVKARDFEVPACGSVYLTTYNPDLALFYDIGKEILAYTSVYDLINQIRWCLRYPAEAEVVALSGYRRAHADHTWLHRYKAILEILGIL